MGDNATPSWFHRVTTVGMTGRDVVVIQRKVGASITGVYDTWTEQRVNAVQRRHHLHVTGEVDEETAEAIGETVVAELVPAWFHRPLHAGHSGPDVAAVRELTGCNGASDEFDDECEQAVRRWQSAHWIIPDGLVSETIAVGLGDL